MTKLSTKFILVLFTLLLLTCTNSFAHNNITRDIQLFTTENKDSKIVPTTTEGAFNSVGLSFWCINTVDKA